MLKHGLFVSVDVTVAVTDEEPAASSQDDMSYALCSVVTSPFTGLARCDVSEAYGHYVFIKARPKRNLKLCEVEVFAFRELCYIVVFTFFGALNRIRVKFLRMCRAIVVISCHYVR